MTPGKWESIQDLDIFPSLDFIILPGWLNINWAHNFDLTRLGIFMLSFLRIRTCPERKIVVSDTEAGLHSWLVIVNTSLSRLNRWEVLWIKSRVMILWVTTSSKINFHHKTWKKRNWFLPATLAYTHRRPLPHQTPIPSSFYPSPYLNSPPRSRNCFQTKLLALLESLKWRLLLLLLVKK